MRTRTGRGRSGRSGLRSAPHRRDGRQAAGGKIVEIDAITDPERLRALDLAVLDD
jgi:hypothetical protein